MIEYEFYYEEGRLEAHPAIGRLAFLITPDGVRGHHVTDGEFERTGLSPENVHLLLSDPGSALSLKPNSWNRVRIILSGDHLQLQLNGGTVATHQLAEGSDRTFGLFHFSDQTQLHVRHISWRGEWPKQLPDVLQQEMAGRTIEDIDAGMTGLSETFGHDFAKDGLPQGHFKIATGTLGKYFSVEDDGLHAMCRGVARYRDAAVGLGFEASGDFDISAKFRNLVTECAEGDSNTIALRVAFADKIGTRCSLRRTRLKDRRTPLKPLLRCFHEFDKDVDGTEAHTRRIAFEYETCEATAGTLRLARRGNQLYYLLAEEKSEYFRVIGVREVCTEPIMDGGIQLLNQLKSVTEDAVTSMVWTNVTVQAEKILRDPANQPVNAQSLAKLNQGRDQLSPLVDFDFASMQSGVEKFTRWGNVASFRHTPDGVRFTSLGTENWTSTGAWPGTQKQGDFDASSTFEIEKIVAPEPIGESNVYMQAIFSDEQETCYNFKR